MHGVKPPDQYTGEHLSIPVPLMFSIAFVITSALWIAAQIKRSVPFSYLAMATHLTTIVVFSAVPTAASVATWPGLLVTATGIPGLLILLNPKKFTRIIGIPQAALAFAAAVWVGATSSTLGLDSSTGYTTVANLGHPVTLNTLRIFHVATAVLATGAILAATIIALYRLRGKPVGLLLVALILTSLPMTSSKATSLQVYKDGEPLAVQVQVNSTDGSQGILRTLNARAELPWEWPIRCTAICLILIAFLRALVVKLSGGEYRRTLIDLAMVASVAVHAGVLLTNMYPLPTGWTKQDVMDVATNTVSLEIKGTEYIAEVTVDKPPYQTGPGSPVNTLPLALFALVLVITACKKPKDAVETDTVNTITIVSEKRMASLSLLLLALTAVTGILWSDFQWGSPVVYDPKIYAMVLLLALNALYFLAFRFRPPQSALPSWIIVMICGLLLFSILGPEMGWTAPTLHHFTG
jgi:hypothetical protein